MAFPHIFCDHGTNLLVPFLGDRGLFHWVDLQQWDEYQELLVLTKNFEAISSQKLPDKGTGRDSSQGASIPSDQSVPRMPSEPVSDVS